MQRHRFWQPMDMRWNYLVGSLRSSRSDEVLSVMMLTHAQIFERETTFGIHRLLHNGYGRKPIVHGYLALLEHSSGRYYLREASSPPLNYESTGARGQIVLGTWSIRKDQNNFLFEFNHLDHFFRIVGQWESPKVDLVGRDHSTNCVWSGLPRLNLKMHQAPNEGRDETYEGNGFYEWGRASTMPRNFSAYPYDGFHILLDNGYRIVLFMADWSFVSGVVGFVIGHDGEVKYLSGEGVRVTPLDYWKSAKSGVSYPVKWLVEIKTEDFRGHIQAIQSAQELNGKKLISMRMWYGVASIRAALRGQEVKGFAYLHLIRKQRSLVRVIHRLGDLLHCNT